MILRFKNKTPKKGDIVKCHSTPPRRGIVQGIEIIPYYLDNKHTSCEAVVLKECEISNNSVKHFYLTEERCVFINDKK